MRIFDVIRSPGEREKICHEKPSRALLYWGEREREEEREEKEERRESGLALHRLLFRAVGDDAGFFDVNTFLGWDFSMTKG